MGRKVNAALALNSTPARTLMALALDAKDIQRYEKDALLSLQRRLGLGDTWGLIEIPLSWLPPGVCSANATRLIDIRKLIHFDSIDLAYSEMGVLLVTRYALLCFLVPVLGSRVGAVLLAPTTISSCIKSFCKIAVAGLKKTDSNNSGVLSRLTEVDLGPIVSVQKNLTELNRLLQYATRGYWSDIPCLDGSKKLWYSRPGNNDISTEQNHSCKSDSEINDFPLPNEFLPFSDKFVSESGWRFAWIVENLGPVLLPCAEGLADIYLKLKPC